MGSLRDQMLKTGLIDKSKAAKAEREARRNRREREIAGKKAAPPPAEAPVARNDEEQRRVDALIGELVGGARLTDSGSASRRWYFVARGGAVPCWKLSDELARRLEQGKAAIAESPDGEATVIDAAPPERIRKLDPSWLRHWNEPKALVR